MCLPRDGAENQLSGIATVDWKIQNVINEIGRIKPTPNSFILMCDREHDYILAHTGIRNMDARLRGGSLKTLPWYENLTGVSPKAEMKKNLAEYYAKRNEGKEEADQIPVPSDEELDKEVSERLEFEYKQEADARLTRDIRNYFVEKAALELPEDYLKRWLFQMNKGKYTMEEIEKEFPSFLEDFRWQLVRDFLMEKYNLTVTRDDVQKAAEGYVAYQYAMYGIGNVPEQMIKEAADRIMAEGKQTGMLQEQVENNKVLDALKAEITIKPKKIALSKFKELK